MLLLAFSAPLRSAAQSSYEWARTAKLLEESGLTLAQAPEGKRIAYVRIVRDDVFVDDEKWPVWFDWFHHLSQDRMVRRELLFAPGESYTDKLVEETMRNLRSMGVFALVRIVAVETDSPDSVGVVVHTRDVWSLRLEQEANITRQINSLRLLLVERNLLGLNKDLGAEILLVPDRYRLMQTYVARRMLGSALRLEESAHVKMGRFFPGAEGGGATLSISQPYYRLAQRHSWQLYGGYDSGITRQLDQNADYRLYEDRARRVYESRVASASAQASYRFGDEVKIVLGGGVSFRDDQAFPIAETQLPDDLREGFERDVLPLKRRDLGPRIYYDMFLARYRTLQNLGTFSQSENIRVGPSVGFSLYTPVAALGSTANAMVFSASVAATHTRGRGILSGSLSVTSRLQGGRQIDQRLLSEVRMATPYLGPVRFVTRLGLDARRYDTRRTPVSLGSDRGLRGYDARSFTGNGASRILANFELRTAPLKLGTLFLGGVLFYDVGSLYDSVAEMKLHHAAGVGLRFFLPQFNRYPFSYDVGVPIQPGQPLGLDSIVPTLNTAQSVPVTDLEVDTFP